MNTINSHPGIPLIHHLKAVASNCLNVAQSNTTDFYLSQDTKETIAYICGAFHDIGKATKYFQDYLKNPQGQFSSLKNHSLPSAVFVFYAIKQIGEQLLAEDQKLTDLMACLCFIVVKRHHGHLRDFNDEVTIRENHLELQKQFSSIDSEAIQKLIDNLLREQELTVSWQDFLVWINSSSSIEDVEYAYFDFKDEEFSGWDKDQKSASYYLFLWLFGTLLYSDKSDVILAGTFPELPQPTIQFLSDFRQKNGFNNPLKKIDQLKNEAYFSVIDKIEKDFSDSQRFYSITMPTGLGKTLTALGAALKIKEKAALHTGKLIIAIPFTSIIDQNYQVYNEVFTNPNSAFLLKHHHLSEPEYKEGEDTVRSNDQSQHLIETWQSAVVVTTFVQLLECLVTNNKTKLLKFSSLSNSIIILDEVQQIPHHLWKVIRTTFFTLAKNLNCYFLLMSATQPLIFHPGKEIEELVPAYQKYFKVFNRTRLVNKTNETIPLEKFIEDVVVYTQQHPMKDILIILNTKKITLECFRELKHKVDDNTEIRYLTTLITPIERKNIISEIKANKQGEKRYLIVSTQLVEAGVDISVDTVFRALAPLDSIIQAAGRANRYNEKPEVCDIFIYKIEEQYKISCRLYGKELILKTELVIESQQFIKEEGYLSLIENYFEQVKTLADYSDNKLLHSLLNLEFEKTGEFQLIEEIKSESIFVALDEKAKEIWNIFLEIQHDEALSSLDRRKKFSKIKSSFYEYVINIPIPHDRIDIGLPYEPQFGFYYWGYDEPEKDFYTYNLTDPAKNEGYSFQQIASLSF
jgi:CRISPR-associated endonuclease/helicase Cas3